MQFDNQNDMQQHEEHEAIVEHEQSYEILEEIADIKKAQEQAAVWKEQASRILADYENFQKRTERDRIQWMQLAQGNVVKDLLPVVDNFDRALSAKTENNAELFVGIEMIYKSFMQVLHKYGVTEFTEYTTFDPELHEALMDVESADHASGQIVQVLEKGFMMKDKVLRPAKVMIAK